MRQVAAVIGSLLLAAAPARAAPLGEASGLAARLAGADAASEHWDLTARFEGGHYLFARFLVTNQGPGIQTAVASVQLVLPDGTPRSFHWGRRQGRWSADAQGLRLKVGSAILDLQSPERRLEIDSTGKGIRLALRFAALSPQLDDSGAAPGVAAVPPAPVEGELQLEGMDSAVPLRGTLFLRHAWTNAPEVRVASRWIDVLGGDGEAVLSLWDLATPDGATRSGVALLRDGAPDFPDGAVGVAVEGAAGPEPERYPAPRRLLLRGDGVAGEVILGRELLRMDPMRVIPQPFRWWLARQSAPRRSWHDALLRVRAERDGETLNFEGRAVVAVTWLDPAP